MAEARLRMYYVSSAWPCMVVHACAYEHIFFPLLYHREGLSVMLRWITWRERKEDENFLLGLLLFLFFPSWREAVGWGAWTSELSRPRPDCLVWFLPEDMHAAPGAHTERLSNPNKVNPYAAAATRLEMKRQRVPPTPSFALVHKSVPRSRWFRNMKVSDDEYGIFSPFYSRYICTR